MTADQLALVRLYHQFLQAKFVSPPSGDGHPQALLDLLLTTPPYPILIFFVGLPVIE
jgi:hypothetical protein